MCKNKFMKISIFIFFIVFCSLTLSAQTGITKTKKPSKIWIYTEENTEQEGVLAGATDSVLFIYPGSMGAYRKEASPQLKGINYKNIHNIKIKKEGEFSKGLLIGAGIGLFPLVFGQGGAYVAIFTFPLGIITGSVIGATSRKKYEIKGDPQAFAKFTRKYIK
jgi:hypothetical protein